MAKRKTVKRAKPTRFKTPEWQKKRVPDSLWNAYLKVSESGWEDDDLYGVFAGEAEAFLGKDASDPIERGRLTVCLARMRLGSMTRDFSYKG